MKECSLYICSFFCIFGSYHAESKSAFGPLSKERKFSHQAQVFRFSDFSWMLSLIGDKVTDQDHTNTDKGRTVPEGFSFAEKMRRERIEAINAEKVRHSVQRS